MPSPRTVTLGLTLLLAGPLAAQDPAASGTAGLLAADRAAAETSMTRGFAAALGQAGADDLVLVYPGAPVLRGRDAIVQAMQGQQALTKLALRWVPLHGEVSRDGTTGVTWGVIGVSGGSDAPIRFGKYLEAWRRDGSSWRLVARSDVGLLPGAAWQPPTGFAPPALPPLPAAGAEFARADRAFAAQAGIRGAAAAFATWAADDAVTFAGSGELNRGPAAIRQSLADDTSRWEWHPVVSGGATDLGYTVGEAVITSPEGTPFYAKYLTLWRRAGGKVRFLADGGNARPAPATP
ncbi:MAG: nuclear transport factor 2 family protein [Gemmatimonadales bacterium]